MEYPIGIQSFENIRRDGYVYVDKTDLVYKLAKGHIYFLARPRRFGKSLLVSTLKAYFEGRRDLFEGLKMMDLEREWTKYPVISFDFNGVRNKPNSLRDNLLFDIHSTEQKYGIQPVLNPETGIPSLNAVARFRNLIIELHKKTNQRVVVLIDEYEHSSRSATDAIIVQGGVMEQWVSNNQKGTSNKIPYIHVGGNVWFKEFHTGCHQDKQIATKHSPISVTGGDYDEFYLTGLYRGDITNKEDNAECYINGGRFGTVCGAAMEGIGKADGADNTGNITWLIQNADIKEFYAGGLNAAKPVTGNLSTTIVDSYVDIFCGGPKFGDMSSGKIVTTTATGCTFGTFFGAGYGGNSYSRYAPSNQNSVTNIEWNTWVNQQYKQEYNATYGGVSTQFSYQFIPMSDNKTNVARIFVDFVKFSLATTRNVTSTLTNCTITGNFYGGGSLGKVVGPVSSTLTNCTVKGNVFGAGFSAQLPNVEVDNIGFRTEPYYYTNFGTYRTGEKGETTTYTWDHGSSISIDKGNQILYTTENLDKSNLGSVQGNVTLTIQTEAGKTTTIGTAGKSDTGNVFGGGEESYVINTPATSTTSAIIHTVTVNLKGPGTTNILGNVFGGGDQGEVEGSTKVNIEIED